MLAKFRSQIGGTKRVLVLVLVFLTIAALVNSILIVQRQAALERVSRYNLTWLLSQAAHESLRLQEVISAAALPGSDVDADDVGLRFDVVSNRLTLLRKGEAAEFIVTRPELKEAVDGLASALAKIEPLIEKLPDAKVAHEMRQVLEPSVPRMLQMAAAANQWSGENVAKDQNDLSFQHWSLTALLLSALLIILALLYRQQRIANKLEREMEQLNSLFQSTGAFFLMLDRDERIVIANQTLRDFRGDGDRDITGEVYSVAEHGSLDAGIIERWKAATTGEVLKPVEYESRAVNAEGRIHIIKNTATPIQDKLGRLQYIVVVGVDDTERRQAEMRLFDASRLANLGEMASGVAHEINQPLAVIRMAADSLQEELESDEAKTDPIGLFDFMKEKLRRISAQTDRASGIIRELRTVARKPSDEAEPFGLADAARISGDLLTEQLRASRVELKLELPTGPGPVVLGQMSRLQQVVINLVLNARDAILEHRGTAAVGVLGHITVRVLESRAKGTAQILVEDDGSGIPDHALPRLFEPFFTTKPTGKGTGLGLSISYDIVRHMHGELSAENRKEGGARFRITLPVAQRVQHKSAA
ncbi:MAG TPA: ATP-binding protein [Reyranellaceae bacterium]|nr:ATP-binding protein [Reyranellaceae bacterium]